MEQKKIDLYLILGIIFNIFLVGIFYYLYTVSQPNEGDLKSFGDVNISGLTIYNSELDKNLSALKKVENLPINIYPNEIGKQNPYQD